MCITLGVSQMGNCCTCPAETAHAPGDVAEANLPCMCPSPEPHSPEPQHLAHDHQACGIMKIITWPIIFPALHVILAVLRVSRSHADPPLARHFAIDILALRARHPYFQQSGQPQHAENQRVRKRLLSREMSALLLVSRCAVLRTSRPRAILNVIAQDSSDSPLKENTAKCMVQHPSAVVAS
jgi:hypothetical protein